MRLTIERLGAVDPSSKLHGQGDILVLCADGKVVPNQIRTLYSCEVDEQPVFRVEFACFVNDPVKEGPVLEMVPININNFGD